MLGAQSEAVNGPVAILAQVNFIQISFQNLIFAESQIQSYGHQGFFNLAPECLVAMQVEVLHQLLGQCAATLDDATGTNIGQHGPGNALWVDAMMFVKPAVFDGYYSFNQNKRHVSERQRQAVLACVRIELCHFNRFKSGQGHRATANTLQ